MSRCSQDQPYIILMEKVTTDQQWTPCSLWGSFRNLKQQERITDQENLQTYFRTLRVGSSNRGRTSLDLVLWGTTNFHMGLRKFSYQIRETKWRSETILQKSAVEPRWYDYDFYLLSFNVMATWLPSCLKEPLLSVFIILLLFYFTTWLHT